MFLFFIHIAIALLLGAIGAVFALVENSNNAIEEENVNSWYEDQSFSVFVDGLTIGAFFLVLLSLIMSAFFGIIFSVVWLLFSKLTPQLMLYANVGSCIVLTFVTCAAFAISGYFQSNYTIIATAGGLFFFNFIYVSAFFAQGHLKQSAELLHVCFEFLQQHRELYRACAVGLAAAFIWMIIWASCFLLSQQLIYISPYLVIPAFLYFLFSWYWSVHGSFFASFHFIIFLRRMMIINDMTGVNSDQECGPCYYHECSRSMVF